MKSTKEVKTTIEIRERSMMPWLEATTKMNAIVKKRNEEIKKTQELMEAFEDAGITSVKEPEEQKKFCCVVS